MPILIDGDRSKETGKSTLCNALRVIGAEVYEGWELEDGKKKPGTAVTGAGNKKYIRAKYTPSRAKMQALKMILRLLASCAFMLPLGAGVLLFADCLTGDAANGLIAAILAMFIAGHALFEMLGGDAN